MRVTFIIPCRNNLQYLRQAVSSIEEHYGDSHDIVVLDDASTDGTWEWITNNLNGENIKTYRNESNDRVGHTVLYDIGISMASTDLVTILHSDMIVTKNYVENMVKHIERGIVVSGTRIEPPLHPPGPEKLVQHFGFEPDEFLKKKVEFESFVEQQQRLNNGKTTTGIFAPWLIYKDDFIAVGGHDLLFAPMELEDSDIFNRFVMNGYRLIQSRDAFVYHMTCRGSRFKDGIEIEKEIPLPDGTIWYKPKDSQEYLELRQIKFREWYRKWHSNVLHDSFMMPIVPIVYKTKFTVTNCNQQLLSILEPFSDKIVVDCDVNEYIARESKNTMYDLQSRVVNEDNDHYPVEVSVDGTKIDAGFMETIVNLPYIIEESGETNGSFSIGNIEIELNLQSDSKSTVPILPVFKNIF